ncbi:sulfatase-like hydrolase/transferase [Acidobacteria bacterium AH-259-G07]|nr:sulfatase-like hydrolase/transferase [Acidobacteria bacterium AH-259-G07]
MKSFTILPLIALLFFGTLVSCALVSGTEPSILLVTIDTLRADRVGRHPASITPAMDSLAQDGIRFSRAMVQVPITLPSHASILTGTYPMYHGVRDFGGSSAGGQFSLFKFKEDRETLAEILKRNGYITAAFVSSFALDSNWGLDQGFDLYHDDFGFNAVERRGDETVDLAIDWLSQNRSKRFFLWVHLFDPHDPYEPPEPYRSRFSDKLYDGEVAFADAQLGRLIDAVKDTHLYDSSLIVVMSDHGEGLGEHGEETHGFFVYNSTLHIPLIIKLPGNASGGVVIGTLVQSLDLAPTILQTLGRRGNQMQGRGLLGLIRRGSLGGGTYSYGESYYARYHFGWSSVTSYQDERYKYIRVPRQELYDLRADPGEEVNLYNRLSDLGKQYDNLLASLTNKFKNPTGHEQEFSDIDEATRQRLQSLGYVALSAGKSQDEDSDRADPKDKIELFNSIRTATLESENRNYSSSIRRLREVIKKDPKIYAARYLQGFNYYQTSQFMSAVGEFKAALELSPDSPGAVHYLAMSYFQLGMTEAAVTGYERLLQLQPDNPQGHIGLGHVHVMQKNLDRARSHYQEALNLGAFIAAKLGFGRVLVAEGHLDAGIEEFQSVLQRQPQNTEAHLLLAFAYRQKGMDARAQKHLEQAKALGLKIVDQR